MRVSSPSAFPQQHARWRVARGAVGWLAIIVVGLTLGGCATSAYRHHGLKVGHHHRGGVTGVRVAARAEPNRDLLTPLAQPDCEFKASDSATLDARVKLDYERQCYRQAEAIARERLRALQERVNKRSRR